MYWQPIFDYWEVVWDGLGMVLRKCSGKFTRIFRIVREYLSSNGLLKTTTFRLLPGKKPLEMENRFLAEMCLIHFLFSYIFPISPVWGGAY